MDERAPLTRTGIARFDYQIECCEQHPGKVFNVGCHIDPAELQERFGERIVNCDREEYDSSPEYDPGMPNPVDRLFDATGRWAAEDDEGEVVILGDILEHFPVEKIPGILKEAHRVAPVLCVTVPEDTRIDETEQRDRWQPDFYNRHTTVMTRPLIEKLVTDAGFRIDRLWTAPQEYDEVQGHALTAHRGVGILRECVLGPIYVPLADKANHSFGFHVTREGFHGDRGVSEFMQERLHPGDDFLDVGAHVGWFSMIALKAGCAVTAVEPDPENTVLLRKNLPRHGATFKIHEVAATDFNGTTVLFRHPLNSAEHRLAQTGLPETAGAFDWNEGVEVRATTIDRLLPEVNPSLVKIDVEGSELAVLHGMTAMLGRCKPWLIVERSNENNKDAVALLEWCEGYGRVEVAGKLDEGWCNLLVRT